MNDLIHEGRNIQETFKKKFDIKKSNSLNEGPIFDKIKSLVSGIKNTFTNNDEPQFNPSIAISSLMKWESKTQKGYKILSENIIKEFADLMGVSSDHGTFSGMEITIKNKNYVIESVDGIQLNFEVNVSNFDQNIESAIDLSNGNLKLSLKEIDTDSKKKINMSLQQFGEILNSIYSD